MLTASVSRGSVRELSVKLSKVPASVGALIASLEKRFVMRRLLSYAIIGLCVGALIGGLAFGALATDTTATAFLRLQNPADLIAIAGGASQVTPENQDNTSKFVAGEIAYLSGRGFAQAVARKMAKDEPAILNIAQASESSVVTISCSSRSGDEATGTVQTAIDLYRQELAQRVDEQLRTILPTLSEWQQRDTVDATRVQELQRVRESVELQAAASTLLIVQPPTPNQPSSQQWVIGVFLGALVGGSGAVLVLLARRRRSGRGSLVNTLCESVDGVLVPAVDLDMPPREGWADEQVRLARTLYAQCPSAGPTRVILVIGASSSSGGSVVASLLENAAADSRPVAATTTSWGQHSLATSAEPTTTHVVDGGTFGDSTITPDVIGAATDIVLVVRVEADTMARVLALLSATAASAAPVVAVFTYRRSLRGGFRRRSKSEPLAVPPNAGGVDAGRDSG
jgi:hypothetical protein